MRPLSFLIAITFLLTACGGDAPRAPEKTALSPDVVALDSAQAVAADLALVPVRSLAADTLFLTGSVTFDAGRVSHVGPRAQGRLRQVHADVGTHLRAGDTLAVLDSPELGAMQTTWAKARVAREVAARNFERTERLFADGIVSERRRLEADAELRSREADLAAAAQALAASGAEADTSATGLFVLRAPLSGEVVEKHATVGEVVGPEADLFTVGNLDELWLLLDLFESDLAKVRLGLPARVVAQAYPDRAFSGIVSYIGAQVDSVSRTVKIRIEIPNPDHRLKPGMFVRASVATAGGSRVLGVPREAVQSVAGAPAVFIPLGQGKFRMERVRLGADRAGGWVELLEGPAEGTSIVGRGSFTLKAQLEGAGAAED